MSKFLAIFYQANMLHANSSAIAENVWWDFNSSTGKANRIFYIEKDFRALKAHRMCESVVCTAWLELHTQQVRTSSISLSFIPLKSSSPLSAAPSVTETHTRMDTLRFAVTHVFTPAAPSQRAETGNGSLQKQINK